MERLMEKLPLLGIIAVLLLVLLIVELRARKRESQPAYQDRATLVKKNISVEQIGGRYQTENRHIDELIFETVSGETVTVRTAWSTSQSISVGDRGTLIWQGDRLVQFEKDVV